MKLVPILYLAFTATELEVAVAQWNPDAEWWSGWGSGSAIACGDAITTSAVLQGDLSCDCTQRPALVIQGSGVVLDLNSYFVSCQDASLVPFDPWIGVGIRVEGKLNSVLGPGNVTESTAGIILDGDGGHTVSRVSVYNVGNDGLRILSDSNVVDQVSIELVGFDGIQIDSDRNSVTNSEITNVGIKFIRLSGSFNLVEGNRLDDAAGDGISSDHHQYGNRLIRNVISRTFTYCVSVFSGGGGHEIRGNQFFCNGEDLYEVISINGADDVHIVDNHFFDNLDRAVYLSSNPGNVVIKNNIMSNNGYYGILCNSCANCHFIGNVLSGNERGIHVRDDCDNTLLSDNIVTQHTNFGITIDGGASNTVVTKNTIWGNGAAGSADELIDGASPTPSIIVNDNTIETD